MAWGPDLVLSLPYSLCLVSAEYQPYAEQLSYAVSLHNLVSHAPYSIPYPSVDMCNKLLLKAPLIISTKQPCQGGVDYIL